MATLPNFENAYIDVSKLTDYCLNENHPIGKHKARLFLTDLSITHSEANILKRLILEKLPNAEAFIGKLDKYGQRFTAELKIRNFEKEALVVTAWIILDGENFPRFTTCYIKR